MLLGISKGPPGPHKFVAFKGKPEFKGNEQYKAHIKEAVREDWEDRVAKFTLYFWYYQPGPQRSAPQLGSRLSTRTDVLVE